ncbi:MAG TPA: TIGR02281 family clan AA aspartic protease [Caulobacteraceae bacterium]|nr:TIGR02281 family clan AA aspartic protease [Caulobacteraceae bacterium]
MSDSPGPWSPAPPPPKPPRRARLGLWLWLGLLAGTGGLFLLAAWLLPADRGDADWSQALRLFGLLALVSSGLASARTIDFSRTARMVAGWAAIFVVAVTAYALRGDAVRLARRVGQALIPAHAMADGPHGLVIGRGDNGAFEVIGEVNGAPVRFVVDTGSTDIVLSPADAERAGVRPAADAPDVPSQTANGVGYGAPATAASLSVGTIRMTDVPVSINKAQMGVSLLGM